MLVGCLLIGVTAAKTLALAQKATGAVVWVMAPMVATATEAKWFTDLAHLVRPGNTFCVPSTITRSPGFSPRSMIHRLPLQGPGWTSRIATVSPGPTT